MSDKNTQDVTEPELSADAGSVCLNCADAWPTQARPESHRYCMNCGARHYVNKSGAIRLLKREDGEEWETPNSPDQARL